MFPQLDPAQIERIAAHGKRRRVTRGEIVFDAGEVNTRFFVVLSGKLEIVQPNGNGERQIVVHGPGQFSGEINMITLRRSLVRARVAEDGEFLEFDGAVLRQIVQSDSEVS